MSIRTPQPSEAAKIVTAFLAKNGISLRHSLALEVVARTRGYPDLHAMQADCRDDKSLDLFMQAQAAKESAKSGLASSSSKEQLRRSLRALKSYSGEDAQSVFFSQFVSYQNNPIDAEKRGYSAVRLAVHFESDPEKGRVAPYACFTKMFNDGVTGWTNDPIPAEHETCAALLVKVQVKAIRAEGVVLTDVYEETPQFHRAEDTVNS